jgi:4-amino-4-deoxy-L-arabinose transferase-like glycosyltransferase
MPISKNFWLYINLSLIISLATYLCFFDIDRSFSLSDESLHVQVTQEMWQSGQWWLPTHMGEPYFRKPPFKMWLTFIPLSIFDESNFSYRVIDCLLGVFLILAGYFFTLRHSQSNLTALFASSLMLFNRFYLLSSHGFRYATQDPMLHFLQFIALWVFYEWYLKYKSNTKLKNEHLLFGILIGFSCFSKNVLGFVAPAICFVFLTIQKDLVGFIKQYFKVILIALFLALLLPLSYMLPHFIFTEGAFQNLFVSEVVQRSLVGEHHVDNTWYYFQRIYKSEFLPISALLVGLLWALYQHTNIFCRYLLVWAILPLVLFTPLSSRLFWYIAESFPALCILIAFSAQGLILILKDKTIIIRKIIAILLLIILFFEMPRHFYRVWNVSTVTQEKLDLDRAVPILKYNGNILVYSPIFGFNEKYASRVEKIYLGILKNQVTLVADKNEFIEKAKVENFDFIITPRTMLEETKAVFDSKEFMVLKPTTHRKERAFILSANDTGSILFRKSSN